MPRNFFEGAASGASIAGGASGFNPYITIAGGIVGGIKSLTEKSDNEIRQEQIREYLKRRSQLRQQSISRLNEETNKNIGRINQFTTGSLQKGQGDTARRSASLGRGADEADFLALQGQITGQGSNAIQTTQDRADVYRNQIEEGYDQDVMNAEMEGITAPQDPNFTDILGSIAPAALQYGMNQQYLSKMNPSGGTPAVNPSGTKTIPNTGFDLSGEDNIYSLDENNKYKFKNPVNVGSLPKYPSWFRRQ